jgi:hypothetical protein
LGIDFKSAYRDEQAEQDQPHDEERKVKGEGQKRVEKGAHEDEGKQQADRCDDNTVDDAAILGCARRVQHVEEVAQDAQDDGGPKDLQNSQD